MPQIKKPDDLQLIANLIRFFSYERRLRSWPLIYQTPHWAKALPFTDISMKMGSLSVDLNEILAKIGRAASPFWKRQLFHTSKVRLSKDKGPKTKI